MKNEEVIEKIIQLGWDTADDVTLIFETKRWALTEYSVYSGEWEGNPFQTQAITNWKWGKLESKISGDKLLSILDEFDLSEIDSSLFDNLDLIEAEDGNMDCLETNWERPLTEDEEERLSESEDDVFSLSNDIKYVPEWENDGIGKLTIRVGNEEVDLYE